MHQGGHSQVIKRNRTLTAPPGVIINSKVACTPVRAPRSGEIGYVDIVVILSTCFKYMAL